MLWRLDWQGLSLGEVAVAWLAYILSEDGLFQFGHSKEHRPDLAPLKINQSTLDPRGLPLSTTVISGEQADDPLYVPEIRKGPGNAWTDGRT